MTEFIEQVKTALRSFTVFDALDILILAAVLYALLRFARKRNAVALPLYLAFALFAYAVLYILRDKLRVLYALASNIAGFAVLFVVIVFSPEIKRLLIKLSHGRRRGDVFSTKYAVSDDELANAISEIIRAAQNMSKKNTGALIIISPQHIQEQIIESGTGMNALVSAPLLESIFNTKAPMHDGAVIIRANMILAAGCFLPLSQNPDLPHDMGTRHRAALGVSEVSDVLSIIVSEQTGIISICRDGILSRYYDSAMLQDTLEQAYGLRLTVKKKRKGRKTGKKGGIKK
jgi:diadenylate cyclase